MNEVDYVSFFILRLPYLSWASRLAQPVSNNVAQLIIHLLKRAWKFIVVTKSLVD